MGVFTQAGKYCTQCHKCDAAKKRALEMRSGHVKQEWVYNAPKTVSQFMQSKAFGRLIWGPVGSLRPLD
jgi:hypothetical protein